MLLRARAPKGALLRAWAFGLAPLWTAWIPVLLLDVSAVKAMLDGAQAARVSRFSAAPTR